MKFSQKEIFKILSNAPLKHGLLKKFKKNKKKQMLTMSGLIGLLTTLPH